MFVEQPLALPGSAYKEKDEKEQQQEGCFKDLSDRALTLMGLGIWKEVKDEQISGSCFIGNSNQEQSKAKGKELNQSKGQAFPQNFNLKFHIR